MNEMGILTEEEFAEKKQEYLKKCDLYCVHSAQL